MAYSLFQTLSAVFDRYGYWVVFFGVMLENAGVPVPGETVLIFAGFLTYQGQLNLVRVILTAILGATTGDSLGFCFGRFGGAPFVEKYRKLLPFFPRRFDRAQALFLKHSDWAVFLGRFITGLRVFAGIFAGLFRMSYPRFLLFNLSGAVGWATTFGCLGFFFGSSWERLVHFVKTLDRITLEAIALGAVIATLIYLKRRRSAR